ncbi:MAG: ThuA domain-containing protein [Pirellulales bacterium]|nr:ThuA domain-containing protein [Pirellulales bacterium]
MRRRDMLLGTGAAALGLWSLVGPARADEEKKKRKVLYFTRSVEYEHSVVHREGDQPSFSERILTELAAKHGVEVVSTRDGGVFDGDLDQYDALVFYCCGDPTAPSVTGDPPISPRGKDRFLAAIEAGTGFLGIHSACYVYYSRAPRLEYQDKVDPYVAMLGGEFVQHGQQQMATMRVASPTFPGAEKLGESFSMIDEWYGLKNFTKDLHVILVQDTAGMKLDTPVDAEAYNRPPFPSTWARRQGKGRVFYTAMGHREDVWESGAFQQILTGGLLWTTGQVEADVAPNLDRVAPQARMLQNQPQPQPAKETR